MSNSHRNKTAYSSLGIGVILIGLSPILIKMAHAPGIVTAFYRFLFGGVAMLIPFLVVNRKSKKQFTKKALLISLVSGLCLATDMSLWTTAIVGSNATLPTLMANLAPAWVGLGSLLLFREKQNSGFWVGLGIAIVGVSLLAGKDFIHSTSIFEGIMLGITASVFYAAYLLITESGRNLLDTINYLFLSTLSTTFFLGIYVLIFGYDFIGYDNYTWGLWVIMGVALQFGAWFLINFAQGYLPASIVSPSLLLQPIVTALIAYFFLGELLTSWHLYGGIIVVTGIYIVHFSRRKSSK